MLSAAHAAESASAACFVAPVLPSPLLKMALYDAFTALKKARDVMVDAVMASTSPPSLDTIRGLAGFLPITFEVPVRNQ